MPKQSAGILVYRRSAVGLEVLLGHMGGPFWARKDEGAWTIPKGEFQEPEKPLEAALREFAEETGISPEGQLVELPPVKQSGGKTVHAWACEMSCDVSSLKSNTFQLESPKGSGKFYEFPELDRFGWFPVAEAQRKILKGQAPLLEALALRAKA